MPSSQQFFSPTNAAHEIASASPLLLQKTAFFGKETLLPTSFAQSCPRDEVVPAPASPSCLHPNSRRQKWTGGHPSARISPPLSLKPASFLPWPTKKQQPQDHCCYFYLEITPLSRVQASPREGDVLQRGRGELRGRKHSRGRANVPAQGGQGSNCSFCGLESLVLRC